MTLLIKGAERMCKIKVHIKVMDFFIFQRTIFQNVAEGGNFRRNSGRDTEVFAHTIFTHIWPTNCPINSKVQILTMFQDHFYDTPLDHLVSGKLHCFVGEEGEEEDRKTPPQEPLQRLNKQNSELKDMIDMVDIVKTKNCRQQQKSLSPAYISHLEGEKVALYDDKVILETQYKKKKAENEQLRAIVYNLECQIQNTQRDYGAKQAVCDSKIDQKQELIDYLSEDVRDLQQQCKCLLDKLAKHEKLKKAVQDLEKKADLLRKQIRSMTDELAQHESLTEKQKSDNKILKMDKRTLQLQLKEAQNLIKSQDEIITRQGREISANHELIEELQERTAEMQRTIRDLKSQASQRQEEKILACVQNLEEEFRLLANGADTPKTLGDDSLQKTVLKKTVWSRFASLPVDMVTGLCTVGVFATLVVFKTKLN